ncbi:MAG: hypothetical protein ACLUD2_09445 [Clostridium sp.]
MTAFAVVMWQAALCSFAEYGDRSDFRVQELKQIHNIDKPGSATPAHKQGHNAPPAFDIYIRPGGFPWHFPPGPTLRKKGENYREVSH